MAALEPAHRQRDLQRTPAALWLWCLPGCIAIAGSVLASRAAIGGSVAGALWTLTTVWIGVGCLVNARRCGRVHCVIAGVLLPLLGVIGLLIVTGTVKVSWNVYWLLFAAILAAAFAPELVWRQYISSQ